MARPPLDVLDMPPDVSITHPGQIPVRVFLDTEFSGFDSPDLISIALVSADTPKELYIVLRDGWNPDHVTPFVRDVVLPLLDRHNPECLTIAEAVARIEKFLNDLRDGDLSRPVLVTSDARHDWDILNSLNISMYAGDPWGWRTNMIYRQLDWDLDPGRQAETFAAGVEDYYSAQSRAGTHEQHHALVDARAMKHGWRSTGLE